jgi:hypothetical protein
LSERLEDRRFFSRVDGRLQDQDPFPKNDEKEDEKR